MAVLHKEYYKGAGNGQKNIRVNQDIRAYIENHPDGDFPMYWRRMTAGRCFIICQI